VPPPGAGSFAPALRTAHEHHTASAMAWATLVIRIRIAWCEDEGNEGEGADAVRGKRRVQWPSAALRKRSQGSEKM
jgi:hypothetical protein